MKRLFAGVISLLMICMMLSGCDEENNTASQTPDQILKTYIDSISQEKMEEAQKLVYVPDFKNGTEEAQEKQQKIFNSFVKMALYTTKFGFDKAGGIETISTGELSYFSQGPDGKGIQIKPEEVKDQSIAKVPLTLKMKEGQSHDADAFLMKTSEGWKVLIQPPMH